MSETKNDDLRLLEGKGLHISAPSDSESEPQANPAPADEIYTGQEFRTSAPKKEEKPESIGRDITILVLITLAAGLLLGTAYSVTEDPIRQAQEKARAAAQSQVMSRADSFEPVLSSDSEEDRAALDLIGESLLEAGILTTSVSQVDAALDGEGALTGYVVTASNPEGYGGDVELMCGITPGEDGSMTIEGISFLSLSETAGMGMRAKDEAFTSQFSGKRLEAGEQIVYTRSGASKANEIDAISGCTITTSAVTQDVNAALAAAGVLSQEETE